MSRLLTVLYGALALALVVGLLRRHPERVEKMPIPSLKIGDKLRDVNVYEATAEGVYGQRALRLSDIVSKRKCTVLLFFHSDCSFCQAIAPDWRNTFAMVDKAGLRIPVLWVGTSSLDRGAARFITYDSLATAWFQIKNESVARSIGIDGTPTTIVVDSSLRLLSFATPHPRQENPLPQACTAQ